MASHAEQICYTLINVQNDSESINELSLRNDLEKGSPKVKTEALKKLIYMILNGEKFPPNMLMTIIRYVLPCNDHQIKKLLLIFWEIVPKRGPDGKLLHEMILVCDAYRKDLQHPNEYIRGSTLRFLCKLKEPELLEPLMSSIRTCLEHRHSYVRRNAVLAIFKIFINFDKLIPDAPELILDFLDRETDASCKRNAFLMLIHLDQERALDYLNQCLDQISTFNDILQLVIVELVYKVCIANPTERSRFVRAIFGLLSSATSASVRYEAAATLITLSQAPTALKAAANTFIDICLKESDNNVKLIVLDRLINLRDQVGAAERVLQELLMDLLRILSVASDLEVKEKILLLALDLINSRNAEETVHFLKNELSKTQSETKDDDAAAYQRLLVDTIHHICIKYPDLLMSDQLLTTLLDILTGEDEASAQIIITFVRAFVIKYPQHQTLLLSKIGEVFGQVQKAKVHRGLIWLLGEFSSEQDQQAILETLRLIRAGLGDVPIVDSELRKLEQANAGQTDLELETNSVSSAASSKRLVTADGTYATQSALISSSHKGQLKKNLPPLRSYLFAGDYGIGSALGACLVKLALKYNGTAARSRNSFVAESMLILTSILHFGRFAKQIEASSKQVINDDDFERIANCLTILSSLTNPSDLHFGELIENVFTKEMRSALAGMLAVTKDERDALRLKSEKKKQQSVQVDDHLLFSQLMPKNQELFENQFEQSLSAAIGAGGTATSLSTGSANVDLFSVSKLSKVTQLTGFSDPLYAECYVNVNQYDIGLDVLIVNQTPDTLQNVTLELSTLGDLRLVERPSPIIMAPNDFANIKATVKVASTENGVIFGNIAYDVCGSSCDRNVVVLNDVHIDIMDYIQPSVCSDAKFAQMWVAFEWENKVTVNTQLRDLSAYLSHLVAATNMRCLTPAQSLSGDCCFLAANLYAKSIFGEDALANVSIEKATANGPITGHIRIRAKSQGMALSLGDRVNAAQKTLPTTPASNQSTTTSQSL